MNNKKLIVKTTNLKIVQATVNYAPFIKQLVNCPTWLQYIGDRDVHTDKDAQKFIEERLIASYQKKGFGLWVVIYRKQNIPIGLCGFVKRDYLVHPDIGFALLPEFAGQGLGKEAALATLNYGIEQLHFKTILGITSPDNNVSQKLLLALGLENIGSIVPPEEKEELLLFKIDIQ